MVKIPEFNEFSELLKRCLGKYRNKKSAKLIGTASIELWISGI
jgi:hypothetical protein